MMRETNKIFTTSVLAFYSSLLVMYQVKWDYIIVSDSNKKSFEYNDYYII